MPCWSLNQADSAAGNGASTIAAAWHRGSGWCCAWPGAGGVTSCCRSGEETAEHVARRTLPRPPSTHSRRFHKSGASDAGCDAHGGGGSEGKPGALGPDAGSIFEAGIAVVGSAPSSGCSLAQGQARPPQARRSVQQPMVIVPQPHCGGLVQAVRPSPPKREPRAISALVALAILPPPPPILPCPSWAASQGRRQSYPSSFSLF